MIDRVYQIFYSLRSRLVLACGPRGVLESYNDLVYSANDHYRADSPRFRRYLFRWEKKAIAGFFPSPPARILIGAAGGGREAFALAERGYEVTAFEPSEGLVEGMASNVTDGMAVRVYRARYEDLPDLYPVKPGQAKGNLDRLGPFDAAIVGWASLSHLATEAQRVETLKKFALVTRGPILISFFPRPDVQEPTRRTDWLRRCFPGYAARRSGLAFSMAIGFYRVMSESDVTAMAHGAGLEVLYMNAQDTDVNWPHAVLAPRDTPRT